MSSWLLRRLIPRSRTTNSISNNDIPRENDPDVTVTAASGPDGTSLATYRLHRSMLVSHSHYFKGIFTQSPHTGVLDVCSLPVTDTNRVFPYIIRYMYTHSVDFDEENYVHVCWLALRLGMAQLLYECRQRLRTTSTDILISRLKMVFYVLDTREFVSTLVHVLAKRLHIKEEWPAMATMQIELMEVLLRSSDLDLMGFEKLPRFVDKYIKTREKKYNDKIGLRRVRQLKTLAFHLNQLRELLIKVKQMLDLPPESRKIPPYQLMHGLREHFYRQLRDCNIDEFRFQIPAELQVDIWYGESQAPLKVMTSSSSLDSSITTIADAPCDESPSNSQDGLSPPTTPSTDNKTGLPTTPSLLSPNSSSHSTQQFQTSLNSKIMSDYFDNEPLKVLMLPTRNLDISDSDAIPHHPRTPNTTPNSITNQQKSDHWKPKTTDFKLAPIEAVVKNDLHSKHADSSAETDMMRPRLPSPPGKKPVVRKARILIDDVPPNINSGV